jgi:hypothetical protein
MARGSHLEALPTNAIQVVKMLTENGFLNSSSVIILRLVITKFRLTIFLQISEVFLCTC